MRSITSQAYFAYLNPSFWDDTNILPAFLGHRSSKPIREATVHCSIDGKFALRQGRWKLVLCKGSGGWSLPEKDVPRDAPAGQLYDLDADHSETTNLYDKHPEIVQRLTDLLEKYQRQGYSVRPNSI